jgi:hypothetical protein
LKEKWQKIRKNFNRPVRKYFLRPAGQEFSTGPGRAWPGLAGPGRAGRLPLPVTTMISTFINRQATTKKLDELIKVN